MYNIYVYEMYTNVDVPEDFRMDKMKSKPIHLLSVLETRLSLEWQGLIF